MPAILSDSKTIVSAFARTGLSNNLIRIWKENSFVNVASLSGHIDIITDVKFLNNGILMTSSVDKVIKLWNLTSKITNKQAHSKGVTSLTILSTNKNYLVSTSMHKTIKLWSPNLFINLFKIIVFMLLIFLKITSVIMIF